MPFYRQIVDQIAALVRTGQLRAGDQLPSYRDLAGQVLVSLITVRRAYAELQSAGLVVRKQGRGTFVADTVTTASRAALRKQGKAALRAALDQARGLGLSAQELAPIVRALLTELENEQ
ncbi:transcriptional regulator, GntR family protein [Plesiocystis pacifica SIR-1]|uniref:Transcriptional regulator, GntR family protein n=1 Tax=Plesiocystis pacifica SIR-1 TaxID=391625 RepID=A6G0H2_9BACT|nr:transcriptional regulator, GntR family protein [Plesiocystis pacifica SIR-1]